MAYNVLTWHINLDRDASEALRRSATNNNPASSPDLFENDIVQFRLYFYEEDASGNMVAIRLTAPFDIGIGGIQKSPVGDSEVFVANGFLEALDGDGDYYYYATGALNTAEFETLVADAATAEMIVDVQLANAGGGSATQRLTVAVFDAIARKDAYRDSGGVPNASWQNKTPIIAAPVPEWEQDFRYVGGLTRSDTYYATDATYIYTLRPADTHWNCTPIFQLYTGFTSTTSTASSTSTTQSFSSYTGTVTNNVTTSSFPTTTGSTAWVSTRTWSSVSTISDDEYSSTTTTIYSTSQGTDTLTDTNTSSQATFYTTADSTEVESFTTTIGTDSITSASTSLATIYTTATSQATFSSTYTQSWTSTTSVPHTEGGSYSTTQWDTYTTSDTSNSSSQITSTLTATYTTTNTSSSALVSTVTYSATTTVSTQGAYSTAASIAPAPALLASSIAIPNGQWYVDIPSITTTPTAFNPWVEAGTPATDPQIFVTSAKINAGVLRVYLNATTTTANYVLRYSYAL